MSRSLFAGSIALAALAGVASWPALADRIERNILDQDGKPVAASWASTGRFDALTATGMDDVRLQTGPRWQIRATGDGRAIAQLRFAIEDGALVVGRLSKPRERYGKLTVEITAPSLRAVTAAGSGMVDVDAIGGARAAATVAGSGRATVRKVAADSLSATVAGSGSLYLTGRARRADVTIAGSGGVAGDAFTAGSADVTVAGSGSARFRSPGAIRATIAGSGGVSVVGTTNCDQTRMGSGRLTCTR